MPSKGTTSPGGRATQIPTNKVIWSTVWLKQLKLCGMIQTTEIISFTDQRSLKRMPRNPPIFL